MFAYCENNPIKYVDYTGNWGQQHFYWTLEIALYMFCVHFARIIAQSIDIDKNYPPFPKSGVVFRYSKWVDNQKYHFDRSKALVLDEDSRLHFASIFIDDAIWLWDYATRFDLDWIRELALEKLGQALHCIQDFSAHGNYGVKRDYLPSFHLTNADDENYDWRNENRNSLKKSDKKERKNETYLFTTVVLLLFVITRGGSFKCIKGR
ncbi:MAG: hypothetical protein ACOX45_09975 [Acutalibacteraceae bacterium]